MSAESDPFSDDKAAPSDPDSPAPSSPTLSSEPLSKLSSKSSDSDPLPELESQLAEVRLRLEGGRRVKAADERTEATLEAKVKLAERAKAVIASLETVLHRDGTKSPAMIAALERAGLAESTSLPPHFSTFAYGLKKDQLAEPLHTLVDYYAAWVPFNLAADT